MRRIRKIINYIMQYDVCKSLYWYFKLSIPKCASFHIFPNSIIDIDKKALLEIKQGEFAVNSSWFSTRNRRYVSELRLLKGAQLLVCGSFKLYQGASIHVDENAKLVLRGESFLNTNSTLNCFNYIEIGRGCAISDNVCIHDSDSHIINEKRDNVSVPVYIKDNVLIGKNVTILKGVTIGEGSIIGAGSVVTKSIPPRCLAVGNPARVIKENVSWK